MYYSAVEEEISRLHVSVYIGSTLILALFVIIDLALNEWFTYCYWDIGLIYADSYTSKSEISGESSISNVHDDACSSDWKDYFQYVCPKLCDNLDNFKTAGGLMIAFSVFAMLGMVIVLIMHFLLLCKKRINLRFLWLTMFSPVLFYLFAFVLYCIVADVGGIRGTKNNKSKGWDNPKDFEWKGGMIFAVIIIIFMAANTVHGVIFTRKYFLPTDR